MTSEFGVVGGDPIADTGATKHPQGEAWKSPKEMLAILRSAVELLTSKGAPPGGWTRYTFNKRLAKKAVTVALRDNLPVRSRNEYMHTWDWMKKLFNVRPLEPETQALELPSDVLKGMTELQSTVNASSTTFDVLGEEKQRVWHCLKLMFPNHLTEKISDLPEISIPSSSVSAPTAEVEPGLKSKVGFYGAPLIIADCPLPSQMRHLWEISGTRLCADGGANRLYKWSRSEEPDKPEIYYVPDYIVGDLDSIKAELKEHYHRLGSKLIVLSDQDSTDLDKTLNQLLKMSPTTPPAHVIITGAHGGNVSQELANYHACWAHPNLQIAIVGDNSIVLYLAPGMHLIHSAAGIKCGIIPLGEPCKEITTTGLKWNLDHAEMRFGGLISSSNVTTDQVVTVECSHPVIWTFDVASPKFYSL